MTREEALKIIKECKDKGFKYTFYTADQYHKALDMAIEALLQWPTYYPPCTDCNKKMDEIRCAYDKLKEQEPCEDAISRQAAIDAMYNMHMSGKEGVIYDHEHLHGSEGGFSNTIWDAVEELERLPSVQPKQTRISGKWNCEQRNDWHVNQIDNRDAEPIDITDEYYHKKYDTISCPHCGCTLNGFVVMPFHYCYMCGGHFGDRKLTADMEGEETE